MDYLAVRRTKLLIWYGRVVAVDEIESVVRGMECAMHLPRSGGWCFSVQYWRRNKAFRSLARSAGAESEQDGLPELVSLL